MGSNNVIDIVSVLNDIKPDQLKAIAVFLPGLRQAHPNLTDEQISSVFSSAGACLANFDDQVFGVQILMGIAKAFVTAPYGQISGR